MLVFHGSPKKSFEVVEPRRNIRKRVIGGQERVIFDRLSFHATPHRWIGLAYTCRLQEWRLGSRTGHYNMGVDLYGTEREVLIFGIESLEHSLEVLYGSGGFLYVFNGSSFFHTEGLGDRELITDQGVRPVRIESVDDPVRAMKNEGVRFRFVDESRSEKS